MWCRFTNCVSAEFFSILFELFFFESDNGKICPSFPITPLFLPLKLYPQQSLSFQDGHMKPAPFLFHIDGMVSRRNLHLTRTHGALWANGWTIHQSSVNGTEQNMVQKRRQSGSACLKGLVDVLGPVLVSLFHWQLCLFELQELAPKELKRKWKQYIIFFFSLLSNLKVRACQEWDSKTPTSLVFLVTYATGTAKWI